MNPENQKEPLLFGSMTYTQIMQLRAEYNLGIKDAETRQANSLYQKLKRRGWLKRLKERQAMTGHDKGRSQ
ncbi:MULTISPECIES: hypothetical protein [Acinetobacter]|uniref:Uncharacterized protein n=1 Tax=Acinetobacter baumannii TaxID=470 RepID=A0AA44XTJ0_ACIBA|nr:MULTISPECIES: hypothetical protein [Acinetobacter]EHU1442017.1 hypothetical protein [Acinetobacter baumannii]EHU1771972.1 hypothetical protein [Acinetobacter baumannii]EHU1810539.1 hypothetical protein [Acinetobacter baumannii]EHU1977117.1 hypothetical protein [Acinetobacter baumannii]EHU2095272.1 hypothetical protein [Acinetobacter baumannii]